MSKGGLSNANALALMVALIPKLALATKITIS